MRRLTGTDWKIINQALALLEADDISLDEHGNDIQDDEAASEAYDARLQAVREKVWDRLPKSTTQEHTS